MDIKAIVLVLVEVTQLLPNSDEWRLHALDNIDLSGFIFCDIDFSNFNFGGTKLVSTFFINVTFTGVILIGANISSASFKSVKDLTQQQIKNTFYWEGESPTLPEGLNLPQSRPFPTPSPPKGQEDNNPFTKNGHP